MRSGLPAAVLLGVLVATGAAAQDTIPRVDQGVRVGITYTPGMRPGMLVLGGPQRIVLDSIRTILARDFDYSDQFEMIVLPGGDSLVLGVEQSADGDAHGPQTFVNYSLFAALGADFAVSLLTLEDSVYEGPDSTLLPSDVGDSSVAGVDTTLLVSLYDVRSEEIRVRARVAAKDPATPAFRMAVHRASDRVVRAATGDPGYAATRLAFVSGGRGYTIHADGAALQRFSAVGDTAFSSGWHPDGWQLAMAEFGSGEIRVHDLRNGGVTVVPPTTTYQNITPRFSPDGQRLVFARAFGEGTQLFSYNLAQDCCLQRLTVSRFSDNLSPAFSPDGRQMAFESNRAGLSQIYVMAADGTDQELFAPYDYGVTGDSHSPAWSPDGLNVAFHRTVAGSPQIFLMDVRSREVRQLTSFGRNEDPTWAADGRHLAFKSNRTGSYQLWVIDVKTGRVRQLTTIGGARFPHWSGRIPEIIEP